MRISTTAAAAVPLLLTLLLASSSSSAATPTASTQNFRRPLFRRQYKQIHVLNELANDRLLHVHCYSRAADAGSRDVAVGAEYAWRFVPAPVLGATRWSCDATTDGGRRHVSFESYWEDVAQARREYVGNTYWVAQEEGIYLRPIQGGRDEIGATWVPAGIPASPVAPP